MSESSERPQRYCTNCGAEIRAGNAFCVSCGASLVRAPIESGPIQSKPSLTERLKAVADSFHRSFQNFKQRVSGVSLDSARSTAAEISSRTIHWFKDLPSITKLIVIGIALLVFLVSVSPIARIIAIISFAVSAVVLIVRAIQRKPLQAWSVSAASSFVLIFVFGGISSLVYDSGDLSNNNSRNNNVGLSENTGQQFAGDPNPGYSNLTEEEKHTWNVRLR